MVPASAVYQPRTPEHGVLHAVIREHLETFLAEAARGTEGAGLPAFVEQEFRDYLTCGVLAQPARSMSSVDETLEEFRLLGEASLTFLLTFSN